ncbi:hypothetical protein [uncultured Psychrosphaera sp.]|uniref:hypothetical protein n=1 Tax=uncultured Psychrosphaera sp. TaxID=1403522 RepID=UPI002629441F|nr:hypothetical protein [uncultured Psychrosphaera sp.]
MSLLAVGKSTKNRANTSLKSLADMENNREMQNDQLDAQHKSNQVSGATSGAVIGFQVGGVYGAAIGGTIGLLAGSI